MVRRTIPEGIMIKALNTLIQYGFEELGLNRIQIKVAVENKKSRALPERLGFRKGRPNQGTAFFI
ncbi:GNAT family protein [Gottfriedia sp. OAE603]|uniref:GNAT family N-acetyltransferase n=1 Tax=Gottfriedia sp. OAE603 TaxID=2663872 RepID=UPI0019E7D3AB